MILIACTCTKRQIKIYIGVKFHLKKPINQAWSRSYMNVQFVYILQINIRVLYQIILNDFHTVEFHTAIECRTVKSK